MYYFHTCVHVWTCAVMYVQTQQAPDIAPPRMLLIDLCDARWAHTFVKVLLSLQTRILLYDANVICFAGICMGAVLRWVHPHVHTTCARICAILCHLTITRLAVFFSYTFIRTRNHSGIVTYLGQDNNGFANKVGRTVTSLGIHFFCFLFDCSPRLGRYTHFSDFPTFWSRSKSNFPEVLHNTMIDDLLRVRSVIIFLASSSSRTFTIRSTTFSSETASESLPLRAW